MTKSGRKCNSRPKTAGVPASVIAPHSTVQGLLYFDLQGQFDLLNGAHLYVPDIVAMEKQ